MWPLSLNKIGVASVSVSLNKVGVASVAVSHSEGGVAHVMKKNKETCPYCLLLVVKEVWSVIPYS